MGRLERFNRQQFPQGRRLAPGGKPTGILAGGQIIDTKPAEIWDGFSRPIALGDLVALINQDNGPLEVIKLAPYEGPGAPPGTMELVLNRRLLFIAPRCTPQQEFCIVLTREEREERGMLPKAETQEPPPPDPPPPPPGWPDQIPDPPGDPESDDPPASAPEGDPA